MKPIDFQQGPDDELILRCACGEDHFLIFQASQFDDTDEVYVRLVDEWRTPKGLWARLRGAVGFLFRAEHCRGDIVLGSEELLGIYRWCGKFIGAKNTEGNVMKCPTCVMEGVASRVYDQSIFTTCMGVSSYYDEDGKRHYHDPNTSTQGFECSRGHKWEKSWKQRCPGCGE